MDRFFLIIEIVSYLFAVFIFLKKKELAILYIPALTFTNVMIVPALSASIYYVTILFLMIYCILQNGNFYRNNIYSILLSCYFLMLLPRAENMELVRPNVFSVITFFISIPLAIAVYKKYTKEEIFQELSKVALLVLALFIINVLVSTKMAYSPHEMYGISSGILYGDLFAANFNILPIAVFITVLKLLNKKKTLEIVILIVAIVFIMLSLRRTVMLATLLGIVIPYLSLLNRYQIKKFIVFCGLTLSIGYFIYYNTSFKDSFNERIELRKLDERDMYEEKRFAEYEMLYNDMFVENRYSPWFGYDLFNSIGNYGGGFFEERSLHSDITNILHSSGILGLIIYMFMIITAFSRSYGTAASIVEKLILLFCVIFFGIFTITGRYTESESMMLLFFILMLPLAKDESNRPGD